MNKMSDYLMSTDFLFGDDEIMLNLDCCDGCTKSANILKIIDLILNW